MVPPIPIFFMDQGWALTLYYITALNLFAEDTKKIQVPVQELSRKEIKELGSTSYAELFVENLNKRFKDSYEQVSSGIQKFDIKDAEIRMNFPENILNKIISENEFLNVHQRALSHDTRPGHHSDAFYVQDRIQREMTIGKIKFPKIKDASDPLLKFLPKYGYLHFDDLHKKFTYLSENTYGGITAVLRNDVRNRATWTNGDSGARSISPETHAYTFKVGITEKSVPLRTVYVEVQIWGELRLSDVKEFLVSPDINSKNLSILKKTGLPIFAYQNEKNVTKQSRARTKLLFSGNGQSQDSCFAAVNQLRRAILKGSSRLRE